MTEDYSYLPPEQVFVNEQGMFEVIAPALISMAEQQDALWNKQKEENRQQNLMQADGCWYKGTFRRN